MINIAKGKDKEEGSGENRKKLLSLFTNIKLLIIDDLAYSKQDEEVGDFFFHLIRRRHDQHTSTIITSNYELGKWITFFGGNEARAMAAIDRILQDCVSINIKGQSFRLAGIRPSNVRKR